MRAALTTAIAVLLLAGEAIALDHKNLDEGRPLHVEDAYPIASGEWALEAGAGFVLERRSSDRAVLSGELLYGALPNLQLAVGTILSTDPKTIEDDPKSGDLRVSALYNFNQETLTVPALAAKVTVNFPTGVDSSGIDVELKAIATKSFDRVSLHLNVGYEFLNEAETNGSGVTTRGSRDGRYKVSLGASYPVGAPQYTRTTLIADVFTEQSSERGEANMAGVEVGFRHQLTPRVVWDAGVGTEFAGPADRSAFFVTTGVSVGF